MSDILIYSGTDVVSITRMKQALSKDNGFKYGIFSENEIDYCESKESPARFFGGRWCVKESFIKILYEITPIDTINFNEIITKKENGHPKLLLIGDTRRVLKKSFLVDVESYSISISISHDQAADIASASCIIVSLM